MFIFLCIEISEAIYVYIFLFVLIIEIRISRIATPRETRGVSQKLRRVTVAFVVHSPNTFLFKTPSVFTLDIYVIQDSVH